MDNPATPSYSYYRAIIAFFLIAVVYFFMCTRLFSFPYKIPFICCCILLIYLVSKRPLRRLGVWSIQQPVRFLLLATGISMGAELLMDWLIQPLVNKLFDTVPDYSYFTILDHQTALFIEYIGYAWLSAALGEELLFRGFLFDQLRNILPAGKWQAVFILLISSALFAGVHTYQGPAGVAITFLWGLLLGIIYLRTASFWMVMLVHGLVDTIFLSLAYTGNLSYYELPNQLLWGY